MRLTERTRPAPEQRLNSTLPLFPGVSSYKERQVFKLWYILTTTLRIAANPAAFRYNLSVVFILIDFLSLTLPPACSRLPTLTPPYAHQNSSHIFLAGTVKHVAGVIWLWLEWDTKGKALEDSTGKVWLLDKVSVDFDSLSLIASFI